MDGFYFIFFSIMMILNVKSFFCFVRLSIDYWICSWCVFEVNFHLVCVFFSFPNLFSLALGIFFCLLQWSSAFFCFKNIQNDLTKVRVHTHRSIHTNATNMHRFDLIFMIIITIIITNRSIIHSQWIAVVSCWLGLFDDAKKCLLFSSLSIISLILMANDVLLECLKWLF